MKIFLERTIEKFAPDLISYSKEKFNRDLNAGVITGIVAIPLSLALAIASGVAPIYGLYTAGIAGFIAALFAGARFNVSGPAAAMVPILAVTVEKYGIEQLPTIGILAGIFLLLMGIFRLGNLIEYVPPSVILGFTAGVAFLLLFGQINSFFGIDGTIRHEFFVENFLETFKHLNTADIQTAVIGFFSLLMLVIFPKVKFLSKIPSSAFVLVFSILAVMYIPSFSNVQTIEDKYGILATGFPKFELVEFKAVRSLTGPALQIAFLISIESLLCAVVADRMTRTRHVPNQELISQGIANLISPLFGGIPSTAVIARTGNSIKNGAKSRVAAIIHALFILLFITLFAKIGSKIPLSALAAILFVTAWKISEVSEIQKIIKKAPYSDVAVLTLAFILTVFLDLTVAVGIGMFLSGLFIFSRLSTIHLEELNENSDYISEDIRNILKKDKSIKFINMEGNLTMGTSQSLIDNLTKKNGYENLVLRFREIDHIDLSGLEALNNMLEIIKEQGKSITALSINPRIYHKFKKFGIMRKFDYSYETSKEFISAFNKKIS